MDFNSREYARQFREIVDAEYKIQKGLYELSEIRRKMENEYYKIFPTAEPMQLLRDAGIIGERKNTNK